MPDSYVQPSAAPGVGTYQKDHTAAAEPTSNVGGAAFKDGADRDAMPDSYVRPSAAPGVGTYAPQEAASYESGAVNATYASATDRFGPDMTSHVRPSEAPGAKYGKDHALPEETDVKGVIKIQAAIRRRQSRGIFSTLEKAAEVTAGATMAAAPSFTEAVAEKKEASAAMKGGERFVHYKPASAATADYAPPVVAAPSKKPDAATLSAVPRFAGAGSLYAPKQGAAADYAPPVVAAKPATKKPDAAQMSAVPRFAGPGSLYALPTSATAAKAPAAAPKPAPRKRASSNLAKIAMAPISESPIKVAEAKAGEAPAFLEKFAPVGTPRFDEPRRASSNLASAVPAVGLVAIARDSIASTVGPSPCITVAPEVVAAAAAEAAPEPKADAAPAPPTADAETTDAAPAADAAADAVESKKETSPIGAALLAKRMSRRSSLAGVARMSTSSVTVPVPDLSATVSWAAAPAATEAAAAEEPTPARVEPTPVTPVAEPVAVEPTPATPVAEPTPVEVEEPAAEEPAAEEEIPADPAAEPAAIFEHSVSTPRAEPEPEPEPEAEVVPPSLDEKLGEEVAAPEAEEAPPTLASTAKWNTNTSLEDTFAAAEAEAEAATAEAEAKAAAAEAEGARLFAELKALQPPGAAVAEKEDYYNEGEGWDLAGLTSDLAISKASKEGRVTRSKRHPALDLTTD